jgi:hypothetical protein
MLTNPMQRCHSNHDVLVNQHLILRIYYDHALLILVISEMADVYVLIGMVISLICVSKTQSQTDSMYTERVGKYSNKIFNNQLISVHNSRSLERCARECLDRLQCLSYTFQKQNKQCRLHSRLFSDVDACYAITEGGWAYYEVRPIGKMF